MDIIRRKPAPRADRSESAQEKGSTVDVERIQEVKLNPYRKHSAKWMRKAWYDAVERGRWPRIGYIMLGVVIVAAWTAIM